ncbi:MULTISPECIES: aromatic ring-hydroxylating dioxygenase subunit alpha [unclassified Frankia]|uniref:aromatic ring-hydroxylating oxygenase subunit alpha n=1 Tax=unclassified Frankia TaxID=2632575 RepID=UPI002AD578A7|nr:MULTISPECIES: aromatic ring-hydroxylating dioxygenase subunit alpha [unclassified Frankia]
MTTIDTTPLAASVPASVPAGASADVDGFAPVYTPALDGSADTVVGRDARSVMERLVGLYREQTTDQAPAQWREPVRNYSDPQRWRDEIDAIHRRVPLPLALSCELPEPGAYKAIQVLDTPVLITRDAAGVVHASVNACRHRGSELVAEGVGRTNRAKRITCPYHAWSYDMAGCLVGIGGEKTFGPVDRDRSGLVSLPAQERAGIIFVGLTPGRPLDLDNWLGDLEPLLEGLGLAGCHHHSTRVLPGPNWKITVDGYLEGYHFASLHPTTVYKTNLSNIAAFDSWGPHQRNAFALRTIAEASTAPPQTWDPATCVGAIFWLFPGLAVSGGWRQSVSVSLVLPGRTPEESRTQQVILLRRPPADDEERRAADVTRDWFHDVVRDEDYSTGFGVARGLAALAGTDFVFGRNEPGVQHFHRVIDRFLDEGGTAQPGHGDPS